MGSQCSVCRLLRCFPWLCEPRVASRDLFAAPASVPVTQEESSTRLGIPEKVLDSKNKQKQLFCLAFWLKIYFRLSIPNSCQRTKNGAKRSVERRHGALFCVHMCPPCRVDSCRPLKTAVAPRTGLRPHRTPGDGHVRGHDPILTTVFPGRKSVRLIAGAPREQMFYDVGRDLLSLLLRRTRERDHR